MSREAPPGQVSLVFSADAALLGVIRGAISMVAQQNKFGEAEALNLTYAVEQTCRMIISEQYQGRPQETLSLRLDIFADRLEIVLEDGETEVLPEGSPEAFLIARGADRLVQEKTAEGVSRLTWVKYRSQPA